MCNIIVRHIFLLLCFLQIVCLNSSKSYAAMAVEAELVSGKIVQIYETNAIKLDNGKIYQPSREDLNVNVNINEPITLRVIVTNTDEYLFFDYAPGMNSLQMLQAPEKKSKNNSPK